VLNKFTKQNKTKYSKLVTNSKDNKVMGSNLKCFKW